MKTIVANQTYFNFLKPKLITIFFHLDCLLLRFSIHTEFIILQTESNDQAYRKAKTIIIAQIQTIMRL